MKKHYALFAITICLATFFFSFSSKISVGHFESYLPPRSGGVAATGLGDKTGSPLSSNTCSQCHSGGSFSSTINVVVVDNSSNQVTSYIPGESYTIEYTVSNGSGAPLGYAMQSVLLLGGNAQAGDITSATTPNTQIVTFNNREYVDHQQLNSTGVFKVNWTAPTSGSGNVSIYATGLVANGNGGTSGDQASSPIVFNLSEACSPNTGTDTQVACDSFNWIDGNNYTSDNTTATHTLTNSGGCDSVVTLNLTINNSSTGIDNQTACDSFTWLDGNTYTSNNNTATFTETNSVGCDSVVTLNLIINNSTTTTDTQTACDSFTWIDGNTYTSSNNTATFTETNSVGCDSIITLNLTINSINTSVTQTGSILSSDEPGATYQWLNCTDTIAIAGETSQLLDVLETGEYAVVISNNNCIDTSTCYSITITGILESNFMNDIITYPNPTNGNLSIDLGNVRKETKLTLTDINGKLIQSQAYKNQQNLDLFLETENGIYLLIIESEAQKAIIKVIKK